MNLVVSDPLKSHWEETVVREFLLATGNPYKVLRAGLPPEPDIVCEHRGTGRQVGIEVVSVYYDQKHAKSVWMEARGKNPPSYAIRRRDSVENVRLLAGSLRQIRAKSRKRYSVTDHLLLVVYAYPRRLYLRTIEKRLASLRLPSRHPFDEIYIMSINFEVYCLFPNKTWVLR